MAGADVMISTSDGGVEVLYKVVFENDLESFLVALQRGFWI